MAILRKLLCLLLIFFSVSVNAEKRKYTLVIDAGHGGKDAGACANKAKEKDINLAVALAFGRYVERNCPDVRIVYTRKTDVFIPLHERAAIANRNKADVFISIHTNSVASKRPISGMETYTMGMRRSNEKLSAAKRENEVILIEKDYRQHYSGYDPRSPESTIIFEFINEKNMVESVELAQMIQQYTCSSAMRPNKGVKQDVFLVLRETSMPACLIELGYITTPSEAAYLTKSSNVDLMARGIYQAFAAYKKKKTGVGGVNITIPQRPVEEQVAEQPEEKPVVNVAEKSQEVVQGEVKPEEVKQEEVKVEEVKKDTILVVEKIEPVVTKPAVDDDAPVFKVQLFAVSKKMSASDSRLKGLKNVGCYQENGIWKYTSGASTDYDEISRLRKEVQGRYPQAFIVAFLKGERTDVNAAIRIFKKNQTKKK